MVQIPAQRFHPPAFFLGIWNLVTVDMAVQGKKTLFGPVRVFSFGGHKELLFQLRVVGVQAEGIRRLRKRREEVHDPYEARQFLCRPLIASKQLFELERHELCPGCYLMPFWIFLTVAGP